MAWAFLRLVGRHPACVVLLGALLVAGLTIYGAGAFAGNPEGLRMYLLLAGGAGLFVVLVGLLAAWLVRAGRQSWPWRRVAPL